MSEQTTPSKKISIGLILSWVFGVLFALNGIVYVFSEPIPGLVMLIMAAVLLPPVTKLADQKWKFHLSRGMKIIVIIIGFIIFGATIDTSNVSTTQQTETPKEEEQVSNNETEEVNKGPYSVLEVSDVTADNNKVNISGNTDLPTGATLIIGFDVWGRSGSDLYIGVSEKTTVSNGKFNISLDIPQRDEFKNGPYEVSVSFTPRGQSDSVIALVGKDGEKLEGDLVEKAFDSFNTLKLEKQVDIELLVTPLSYTFQTPSEFSQGSAERTLAEYVGAWKNQDWKKMVNFSQKTWVDGESDPAGILEAWYDFKTLKGFEIKDTKTISETTKDVTFIVYYEAITNQIDKKQITARVIKETAAYTPSAQGQWGVNPTSALREDEVE